MMMMTLLYTCISFNEFGKGTVVLYLPFRNIMCVCFEFITVGFGSGVHQAAFCFIVAYATERTLILESKGWSYANEGWQTLFLPVSTSCSPFINHRVPFTKGELQKCKQFCEYYIINRCK